MHAGGPSPIGLQDTGVPQGLGSVPPHCLAIAGHDMYGVVSLHIKRLHLACLIACSLECLLMYLQVGI